MSGANECVHKGERETGRRRICIYGFFSKIIHFDYF